MRVLSKLAFNKDRTAIEAYSDEQWKSLINELMESLESYLDCQIECTCGMTSVGDGFSIDIQSKESALGELDVCWKGILGADLLETECPLRVHAWLFLYVQKTKLVTKDTRSFVHLEFKQEASGSGVWGSNGWQVDEHDEFGFFDAF